MLLGSRIKFRKPAAEVLLLSAKQLLGHLDDAFRLEAVFLLQFLERSGRTEGMHADNTTLRAYVTLPAKSGCLLYR